MDFAALPPEVNSARMYTGPGAAPLLEASAAWQGIATQLSLTASSIVAEITGLEATWSGPSSNVMATTLTNHVTWLNQTGVLASETSAQAASAAAAYEAAFAATVPPPVIVANRTLLASLVATNFLGINTPAIMATEAQYAEMWAQDVAAMAGYQVAAAQATLRLGIFAPNSGNEVAGLPGLLNLFSGASNSAFGNAINSNLVNSGSNFIGNLFGAFGGTGLANPGSTIAPFAALAQGAQNNANNPYPIPTPADNPSGAYPLPGGNATASIGTASKVGALSTPQSWGQAVDPRLVAAESSTGGTPENAAPMAGGIAPLGAAGTNRQDIKRRVGLPPVKIVPQQVGS